MAAGIIGVGHYLPKKILTNKDLEKIVDTTDEWIRTRTGIETRHIAGEDEHTLDLAYEASKNALEHAELDATELDMILVATVTGDQDFPSVACQLQEKLGATKAAAMDITAACSGFIYGVVTAKHFIDGGAFKNILVVGAEKLSKITDWTDRNTCVLFGDGAGAAIVSKVSDDKGILSFDLGADGTKGAALNQENGMIQMNGREVFKFAVRQMPESAEAVVQAAGLDKSEIDYLIPHQANYRIMEAARERLGIDKNKMSYSINKYGNTSAASIPIALSEDVRDGKIKDGDHVVLVGFGGGLTWGAMALRWGK